MLVAFAVMAIAITYNATFRQEGSHPAPMSGDQMAADPARRKVASPVPRVAKTLPRRSEVSAPLPKEKNVTAIQRRLTEAGYDPGPADGVLGEQTRASIIAFESDNELPVVGEASERLLKALILGVSPSDTKSGVSSDIPEETAVFIKSVQKTLAGLGYDPGPVDGLIGLATGKAIRKFESDRKLPVKGRISGSLIKALKEASGGRLSVVASN